MLISFFYYLIITISINNANKCSKIPNQTVFELNHEYIYNNIIDLDTWVADSSDSKNIVKEYYKYKTYLYPVSLNNETYSVWKLNIIEDAKIINPIFNETMHLVPTLIEIPKNHNFLIQSKKNKFTLIREPNFKCNVRYNKSETTYLDNIDTKKIISSLNIITKTDQEPFDGKLFDVFYIKAASNINFERIMTGKGKEESLKTYFLKDFILYEDKTNFKYTYDKGFAKDRKSYISEGNIYSVIDKINKYSIQEVTINEDIDNFSNIRYFVDTNGIFIPVSINNVHVTNAYLNINNYNSYIYKDYFLNTFKNLTFYLFIANSFKVHKTTVNNANFYLDDKLNFNYKVPLILGQNILSKGKIYINDKKREFRFVESSNSHKEDSFIDCKNINNELIFDVKINNNASKASISLSNSGTIISKRLAESLKIKIAKLGMSKDDKSSIREKADIIIATPFEKDFKTISVYVEDFNHNNYNILFGLDFIKDKELTLDYINNLISIK